MIVYDKLPPDRVEDFFVHSLPFLNFIDVTYFHSYELYYAVQLDADKFKQEALVSLLLLCYYLP